MMSHKKRLLYTVAAVVLMLFTSQAAAPGSYDVLSEKDQSRNSANNDAQILLVSNYPEIITEPGFVLNESLDSKPVRLMYYHKNESGARLYICVTLENPSSEPAQLRLLHAESGPDKDEIYCGHQTARRYFEERISNKEEMILLQPGEVKQIIWHLMKPDTISSGISEIFPVTKKPVLLKMSIIDPEYPGLSMINKYNYGKFDQALRTIDLTYQCLSEVKEIPIGSHPYLIDSVRGIELKGNYGMIHRVNLHLQNPSEAFKKVRLLFTPSAGVARAVIALDNEMLETGNLDNDNPYQPKTVYEFILKPREDRLICLQTMPQSGSYYPAYLSLNTEVPRYKDEVNL
ncbi:hypothetical protein ACFL96_08015 [Thermoproteota archaeon]